MGLCTVRSPRMAWALRILQTKNIKLLSSSSRIPQVSKIHHFIFPLSSTDSNETGCDNALFLRMFDLLNTVPLFFLLNIFCHYIHLFM